MTQAPFEVNVSSTSGAPMGRPSCDPSELEGLVYLRRVPFVDNDYDIGGAYWGSGGDPLFCAWDDEGNAVYLRAESLEAAQSQLPRSWLSSASPTRYATSTDRKTGKGKKSKVSSAYIEEMLQAYMEAALWSSVDYDTDTPLDANFSTYDIAKKTQAEMRKDCRDFYIHNRQYLEDPYAPWPAAVAGHNFWLNRNRHGAGFWDSEYGSDKSREALDQAAKVYGEVNLYVNRGKVYSE